MNEEEDHAEDETEVKKTLKDSRNALLKALLLCNVCRYMLLTGSNARLYPFLV